MCLSVRRFHISTAKKDIPCYKALMRGYGGQLLTQFREVPFTETPYEDININWGIPFITQIEAGYIHVYAENPNYKYTGIKYNAYIPKGTKYWKGDFYGKGYASKCVKLIEE
jgi:hypothetical protein